MLACEVTTPSVQPYEILEVDEPLSSRVVCFKREKISWTKIMLKFDTNFMLVNKTTA